MRCIKCSGEKFHLESSIVLEETYGIYKNGRRTDHPQKTIITNEDMSENENIVRCLNCEQGYVLPLGRVELLYRTDFSKVDLKDEYLTEW